MAWVYVLECQDGAYYVGMTVRNVLQRWGEHVASSYAAVFVKRHGGVKRFVHAKMVWGKAEALRLELIWQSSSVFPKALAAAADCSYIEPDALYQAVRRGHIRSRH